MPFFVLAGSTFLTFERAISSFEASENETLEKRFPLAELKNQFGRARPTIDALLIEPGKEERLKNLNDLHRVINAEIDGMLADKSISPEKYGLLIGTRQSWNHVYQTAIHYPESPQWGAEQQTVPLTPSDIIDHIHQQLAEALQGIDRIEILLAHIQSSDNLTLARQLKQQERIWVGIISLIAVSIALLSAILLSHSVLQSMNILISGLERLSEGELDQRIEWHQKDEFGRLAIAINRMAGKLAESQQALMEIATLDGLTGVFNRREFNRLLTLEVERSRRSYHPVSMVMVDIDHFKSINDTYGHQSGDDALQWVSSILQQEVRPSDIVARYGGEEFALILPNTPPETAAIVAERIRHTLESEKVPIQEGKMISVTASLGCSTFPNVGDSEELLMKAADNALYQAKESGRNRVCHTCILNIA